MQLSVAGKVLQQPNAKLSESSLAPYSQVTCEHVPLYGGMMLKELKKASVRKVIQLNEEETPRDAPTGLAALQKKLSLNISSGIKKAQRSTIEIDEVEF